MRLFNLNKKTAPPAPTPSEGILGTTLYWDPPSNDELVWKHPSREILKGARLQVHASQEAALFIDGHCARVFRGGGEEYTIDESANIPLLNDKLHVATGGQPAYFAEIWFVNISTSRKISWFCDERNGLKLRVNGSVYSAKLSCSSTLKIARSESFLREFVGKLPHYDSASILSFFKSNLIAATVTAVKKHYEQAQMRFEDFINERDSLQARLELHVNESFAQDHGLQVSYLVVDEFYSDQLEEYWSAQQKRIALSELGVNYTQERQLDIMQTMAGNEGGAAALMGAGASLGAGLGMGQQMMQAMNPPSSSAATTPPPLPPESNATPLYYCALQGQPAGPLSIEQLQGYIQLGELNAQSLVWRQGSPQWVAAGSVPELAALLSPPPLPPL